MLGLLEADECAGEPNAAPSEAEVEAVYFKYVEEVMLHPTSCHHASRNVCRSTLPTECVLCQPLAAYPPPTHHHPPAHRLYGDCRPAGGAYLLRERSTLSAARGRCAGSTCGKGRARGGAYRRCLETLSLVAQCAKTLLPMLTKTRLVNVSKH